MTVAFRARGCGAAGLGAGAAGVVGAAGGGAMGVAPEASSGRLTWKVVVHFGHRIFMPVLAGTRRSSTL